MTEDELRALAAAHDATEGSPDERAARVEEHQRETVERELRAARRHYDDAYNEPAARQARALEACAVHLERIADALGARERSGAGG